MIDACFPYDRSDWMPSASSSEFTSSDSICGRYRTMLYGTSMISEDTSRTAGLRWFEYIMFIPNSATHAAVDRLRVRRDAQPFRARPRRKGLQSQSAPVIKLPPTATEDDHLGLLGLLNSSTACFWMKQVCPRQRQRAGSARVSQRRTHGSILRVTTAQSLQADSLRLTSCDPLRSNSCQLCERAAPRTRA